MTNLSTANPWHLSPQEIRVLEAFIAGGRSKSIAADLLVTQKTVESHASNARKKTGTQTLLQAALAYDRWLHGRAAALVVPGLPRRPVRRTDGRLVPIVAIEFTATPPGALGGSPARG